MAKLHNYYVLCPLIDQKSFHGVAEDREEEHVIVTLGRNVVNKYQLSDQKQVGGWTSKDHITSTVIYDKEQESYVGVFNNNTIKTWKEDSDNLDKMKKYKFPLNILRLLPRSNQPPLIIFTNGNCASLPYALDNRKTYESKSLLKDTDTIVDAACYTINKTDHICYIIKNNKESYEILNCPLRDELGDMERSKMTKTKIVRPDDVYVVGKFICTEGKNAIYILWSDAKMTVYNFKDWKTIGTVPWISTLSSVSLAWMGKDHLILFGSNTEQDGAIIVAYNIVLGVGSCRYPMKMYSEDAKLYCFHGRIILEASNHIGMLPYVLQSKRNLSSLLGSHEIIQDECMEIANWDSPTEPQFKVSNEIKDLFKLGLTERSMCNNVIPPLIEKDNFRTIYQTIKQFNDVPESVLVALINYCIKLVNPNKIDVSDAEEFNKLCTGEHTAKKDQIVHKAKFELLNYTLQISFSDALIIPHLRNGLSLDDTLFLLTYITNFLVNSDKTMNVDYESKLFDWCILLMDAFYQQYLMTKDEKVTGVLQNTLNVVVGLIKQLKTVSNVLPVISKLLSGKMIEDEDESSYTIELMEI
ncbi:nucleolar protein 11 [Anticarsia gemmatalis]|uniref:nucleolar protein 11 n=1 Tax=Anticarsia gemmatalis TaxID=129554 RepID=UPI003F75AE6C